MLQMPAPRKKSRLVLRRTDGPRFGSQPRRVWIEVPLGYLRLRNFPDVDITAGQVHESMQDESVMDGIAIPQRLACPRTRPKKPAAVNEYSVPLARNRLRAHGIKPVIPHKSNEAAYL